MYLGTQEVGAGDLWTHSLLTYRERAPASEVWGLRMYFNGRALAREADSDVYVQPPALKKSNKTHVPICCQVNIKKRVWCPCRSRYGGCRWNSFETCQVKWVPTLELFGASQPWSASWASTWADDVLEGCSDTEAGERSLHQSSDPQTCFGRSYFGTWPTSNHPFSILSVVPTANWPHLGISFD